MNMDQDWLDRRLAAESYLPDDGFTSRVVDRLPKAPHRTFSFRRRILMCSWLLAFCLFLVLFVSALQTTQHVLASLSTASVLTRFAGELRQPYVLLCAATGAALLGLGTLRFLERLR